MKNIPLSDIYCPKNPQLTLLFRIMRISIFFLFFCAFSLMAKNSHSQNARVTINRTNVQLESILNEIESQTDYLFIYKEDVNVEARKSIRVNAKPVSEVLSTLLYDSPITYKMEGKHIILTKKEIANIRQEVAGVIIDKAGEPLIGVTVMIKGTLKGTVTNADGKFSLAVNIGDILQFSYIGYISQEIKLKDLKDMQIVLQENVTVLDEVVVVGYGVQKKSSVTGAISQVKAEDMENRTISNAQQALQGKTAGVQIISPSAAPGASPTVRIRGYSSNSTSDPLFVVDGIRVLDISGLDPNDIVSMEVLKDAASAAIYGAEAGNGVVLITTKKGKTDIGKITYTFQYTIQKLGKIPEMLNAEEYINYMLEGNLLTQDYIDSNWDGKTSTIWSDEAFETGKMQKHMLSFSNGGNKGNYYASISYLDNNGIVEGNSDYYKRITGMINAEYEIKKWLQVGTTSQIEKFNRREVSSNYEYASVLGAIMHMDPLTPVYYSPDGLPQFMIDLINSGKKLLIDKNGNYYAPSRFLESEQCNPFIMRDRSITKDSRFNISGSAYADFKLFNDFVFTSRLGYRFTGTRTSTTDFPFYGNSLQSRDYIQQSGGSSTSTYYQWENFANYMKTINKQTVSVLLGMSYQESTNDYVNGSLSANGADALLKNDPAFYYLNYGAASAIKGVSGEKTRNAKLSYFGRIGYSYDDRYMLQMSLRADAADLSYLSKAQRWGYFPAISAGWMLSEEPFFQPLKKIVDNLKIRVSWGQNGSLSALGGYAYSSQIVNGGFYPLVPGNNYTTATRPSSMGNDQMKWETSEQANIGIDARFFNNRLNVSLDYFNKKTKDLLIWNTTPSLTIGGFTSPINAGNVSNKGFEFEAGWRDKIGDFEYSIRGNLATLKNKVTYLDRSLSRIGGTNFQITPITYFEEGYPVYYFRGYKSDGIDPETGDPKFVDLDGNGIISDGDMDYIGDAIPDFTYGITLTAAWKGLDLTIFGTGSQGNDIFNCLNRSDYPKGNKVKELWYTDRWTPNNPQGHLPRANANNLDKYTISDAMVFDGSYFKIKQLQLGYTLPKTLLNKCYVNNFRLYVSLEDFFTITSYPGMDPEISVNATSGMGVDKGGYPGAKKIMFGFNVEF